MIQELNNDSREIINELFKNDDVYIIALEYKWCGHKIGVKKNKQLSKFR